MKALNQWHGMVWKRLPWFDLVSIKGVNSKNMFFPNLHVFRINFVSKKIVLSTHPYIHKVSYQINLFANSCIFQGWKRNLIKAFFQPIRKIEIFHTRCFFLINEIRLLGDHPLATGGTGAWNTPFTVVYAVLSTQMNFQSFQANLLLSWQRPHTVRNGNFL